MENAEPKSDFENSESLGFFENALPPQSYSDFVESRKKPASDILTTLTLSPDKLDLWHMATGVAGECGEVIDLFSDFRRDVKIIQRLRENASNNVPPPPYVKGFFERHSGVSVSTIFDPNVKPDHAIELEFCKKICIELGDVEFYLEGLRQALFIKRWAITPDQDQICAYREKYQPADLDDVPLRLCKLSLQLLDHIKKVAVYGKDIDIGVVLPLLSELEYNLWIVRDSVGATLAEIMHMNEAKLKNRYKSGKYSDKEAVERVDAN